ncbi:MAG: NapC/NirT family cytochrome c [Phycisphaerales bacterium]|nr:MAG: NapC/NirT family cytochrome c [Phycisphaerales bacterium]
MAHRNVDEKTGTSSAGGQVPNQSGTEGASPVTGNQEVPYRPKYVPLWNNVITIAGLFLVAMAIALMLTFWLFTVVTPTPNPYIDIVGYLILPGVMVFGLVIIPSGIFLKSWRLHRRDPQLRLAFRFPRVDLNDPAQRRAAKYLVGSTFALIPVVGVSGYHGYHYTDSAEFCASACHSVMKPQATTYEHSAHARVACAECHIGAGASWFVKSKLSGTRQVLAMWQDSFPRPIPPAITALRPAQETCERCHWPKKFFGAQLREIVRFSSDEQNTRREIDMLLKTGGGDESIGRAEGIHLHMALAGRIEYIATDDRLQEIPWVKYVDVAGNEWIYRSDGRPSSDPQPEGRVRSLDCMDCHNRPAHKFRSPQDALDIFLEVGNIDTTLPFIKREAVAALLRSYPDVDTANKQIGNHLTQFYRANYPEVWATRKASVNYAIDKVREIYHQNFFPSMNVDWQTYPDNIGHFNSPGCFRCHEGRHINQRGEPISHDCKICHTFLNPVEHEGRIAFHREGEFIHPYELDPRHAALRCDQCHSGGVLKPPTCAGCHTVQAAFRAGTLAAFESFSVTPEPMADDVGCEDCHDPSEPTSIEAINSMCMECHEDEEARFEGMLASWKQEADQLLGEVEARVDEESRPLFEVLRQAGPLHNLEVTRIIARALAEGSERQEHLQTPTGP